MDAEDRMRAYEALQTLQGFLLGQSAMPPGQLSVNRRRSEMVRAAENAIQLRALRCRVMGPQFSDDPCWDLLLCLYINWAEGTKISVTDLAYATNVPAPTVTRWLAALSQQAMVHRDGDPTDGRRIWIKLTNTAVGKVEEVLAAQAFGGYCRGQSIQMAA